MIVHGHIWEGAHDGGLAKVELWVERTDADEVAIFGQTDDEQVLSLYLSVDTATKLGTLLGIASLAHEIQAHEAAKIADRTS